MENTYQCAVAMLAVLFISNPCQGVYKRRINLKLTSINGDNVLIVSGEIEPPITCYRRIPQALVTTEETEEFQGTYKIKSNHPGKYWCVDKNKSTSNSVIIPVSRRTEAATSTTETPLPSEEPPQTIKAENGQDLKWPPIKIVSRRTETATRATKKPLPSECPPQTTQDENGQDLKWPAIKIGETYFINGTNCIQAVGKCMIGANSSQPQLIVQSNWNSDWPLPCYITEMNLTEATNQLRKFTRKAMVTRKDLTIATAIVNQALQTNRTVLRQSREDATFVVQSLDSILGRVMLSSGERVNITYQQVSVYLINANKEQPRGIALTNVSENLMGSSAFTFEKETDLNVQENEVDVAIFLPTLTSKNNSNLQLAFFNDDGAFIEEGQKINSRIISVSADSVNSVDILFKSWNSSGEKRCVFWDFNKSGGGWNDSGCELVPSPSKMHDMCRCTHLTHFAELISPSGNTEPNVALDMISLIGCSLSLIGLFGIFLTGAIFWQWRAQIGNKILLHLSGAIALNMIVFLIIATSIVPNMCVPLGALLHYSILTSFCWMLVCAGLQFMRLVSVFKTQHISHLLLKASLFAWGAPLIPVCVLLAINVGLYENRGNGICYPGGLAFYLAVLCPITAIIIVNLIVFGTILYHIHESRSIQHHVQSERKMALRRFLTSLLLFFLLGLTWVFGLMGNLSIVFAYLFCITATLQGFVLFLFFVLGEKKSRSYWTSKSSTQKQTSTSATPIEAVALRRREET